MISGARHRVTICGIPYIVKVRDNELHFFDDGMQRCRVMIFSKSCRHELVNVSVTQEWLPACHIVKAYEIAERFIGPNHYHSMTDKHRATWRICLRNVVGRHIGWRLRFRLWSLWRAVYHLWKLRESIQAAAEAAKEE